MKVCFGSYKFLWTFDEGIFGTRAVYYRVKTLSTMKADREGNMADFIVHAFSYLDGHTFSAHGRKKLESTFKN